MPGVAPYPHDLGAAKVNRDQALDAVGAGAVDDDHAIARDHAVDPASETILMGVCDGA